jgi:hypothetical protein
LARSLHTTAGFNYASSAAILLSGFTERRPIKDVLQDAPGFFKFAARFPQRLLGSKQPPRYP